MGGTNNPSNLVWLTVEEHANAHKELFEKFGKLEDKLAWIGLSNQITNQEAIRQRQALGGKNGSKELKKLGGSIAGKKAKANKTGIFDPKNKGMGGRIGGKIGGKIGVKIILARRIKCLECGMISTPGGMALHQKSSKHKLKERIQ